MPLAGFVATIVSVTCPLLGIETPVGKTKESFVPLKDLLPFGTEVPLIVIALLVDKPVNLSK